MGINPKDQGLAQASIPNPWDIPSSPGTHRNMMLCRMEAKGVMPMPAPMRTACSEVKIRRLGVP